MRINSERYAERRAWYEPEANFGRHRGRAQMSRLLPFTRRKRRQTIKTEAAAVMTLAAPTRLRRAIVVAPASHGNRPKAPATRSPNQNNWASRLRAMAAATYTVADATSAATTLASSPAVMV